MNFLKVFPGCTEMEKFEQPCPGSGRSSIQMGFSWLWRDLKILEEYFPDVVRMNILEKQFLVCGRLYLSKMRSCVCGKIGNFRKLNPVVERLKI